VVLQQNKAIGANTEPAVAKCGNGPGFRLEPSIAVIDHDKIIAGAVIFMKVEFQLCMNEKSPKSK
jgi:hypothetical protein